MATYQEIGPIAYAAGVLESQIDTYVAGIPDPPDPPVLPPITPLKYKAVADAYFITGVPQAGGITAISINAGLHIAQVRAILKEVKALRAWKEGNEPIS